MKKGFSDNSDQYSVRFGNKEISFKLKYSECKRLTIHVHPDQRVSVIAPIQKPIEEILSRVQKKANWILKQKHYFTRFQPLPSERKYISGESHLYLGRQYRLKIEESDQESVKLIGKYFRIYTKNPKSADKIRVLVETWYRNHAIALMTRHFHQNFLKIGKSSKNLPKLRFRKMKTRWGSFGKSGIITLNIDLIKALLYCIDYVITHELCHLKYPNHGKEFYRYLGSVMSDWRQRKRRLEKVVI